MHYQIGTSELHDVVGSRAAQSDNLDEAIEETRSRSLSRSVKEAWLRSVENGQMGDVIVTFIKGQKQ